MGIAGQLCWNMENQWFNTFVYAKIAGDVNIVTCMVIVSALVTTISTFVFGTMSDRAGKRKNTSPSATSSGGSPPSSSG